MNEITQRFYQELMVFAVAYARVAPVCYLLPFMNDRLLAGVTFKNTLIFVIIVGLWPVMDGPQGAGGTMALALLMLKEAGVGLLLAVALGCPFWVATAIGELIDNQRGATISASIDPASGSEASVLAPFVSLFYAAAFLSQGGMLILVQAIEESYRTVPAADFFRINPVAVAGMLTTLVGKGLALAAPVLVVMFLTDVALGLLSRFCPQLNAFSMSLSIKSLVAFLVFHLYFASALPPALTSLFGHTGLPMLLK